MAAWIKIISDEQADLDLKANLDKVRAPNGAVDNVMRVHELRSHTMVAHYNMYMSVLHNPGNTLPDWLLASIASYTSVLNQSDYSLTNHWANAAHLIGAEKRAAAIKEALMNDRPEDVFEGRELVMLQYTKRLTVALGSIREEDVQALKDAGIDDAEILEVNQVCAYFNYVNRQLNGLGVTLERVKIGYYTSTP